MITYRVMTIEDYEGVYDLWMTIKGFGIRSIDDSKEGIEKFLKRNPTTSVVALDGERVIGSILCGHDGRRASFYHVCVEESYRKRGVGKRMAEFAMEALKKEGINKVGLQAFKINEAGNKFWKKLGWVERVDLNYYDMPLNEANITTFNK